MTYQVKLETRVGDLEDYGPAYRSKAEAVRMARLAATKSRFDDVVKVWVDRDDMGVASFAYRGLQ